MTTIVYVVYTIKSPIRNNCAVLKKQKSMKPQAYVSVFLVVSFHLSAVQRNACIYLLNTGVRFIPPALGQPAPAHRAIFADKHLLFTIRNWAISIDSSCITYVPMVECFSCMLMTDLRTLAQRKMLSHFLSPQDS